MNKLWNHPVTQFLVNFAIIALLILSVITDDVPLGYEQWDIIANVAWSVIPWALLAIAFYVCSMLKALRTETLSKAKLNDARALEAEASMWALRHSAKQAREYAARRG